MNTSYDVIVLGLGGMGSATAAQLATRGARTLGLEQFTPAHALGSSHGDTRLIRQAYFEDPRYVPLLQRSYELFADLDHDDPGLFVVTGGLMLGSPDSDPIAGSLHSARTWGLPHEVLSGQEIHARFPTFVPQPGVVGFYEAQAGYVRPERTVLAHLRRAAAAGAQLQFQEPALTWSASAGGVSVTTARLTYRAERLVIAAGAWSPSVLSDLHLPIVVERQLLYWFEPVGGTAPFTADRQPVFIWQTASGMQVYGFPAVDGPGRGVKVAFFRNGRPTDPDALDRHVSQAEVDDMREHLSGTLPSVAGRFLRGVACMYTNTPDEHFVISAHPDHDNVVLAAGFSGHGFKFVPVVGEICADLALDGQTRHFLGMFHPGRFTASDGRPYRL